MEPGDGESRLAAGISWVTWDFPSFAGVAGTRDGAFVQGKCGRPDRFNPGPAAWGPLPVLSYPVSGAGEDRTRDLLNAIQVSSRPNAPSLQVVTSIESNACTAACTSESETDHGDHPTSSTPTVARLSCNSNQKVDESDPVAAIAAALLALSPADRARLAAMLQPQQPKPPEGEA